MTTNIATTPSQSRRLLECGVDPETADMSWRTRPEPPALASQWVSVEDWLPEDEETVLTLSSYGPVLAYYSKQDEMWFAYGNYGDITPTHWLPIPPLKGGDE